MKITNVEWNEGAPEVVKPGMLVQYWDGSVHLVGTERRMLIKTPISKWSWAIRPHELQWLAAMANKHKVRARG